MISDTRDSHKSDAINVVPFKATLTQHNLQLIRGKTHTLQINMGFLCNQVCRHCHLDAGPGRKENMDARTAAAVVAYASHCNFETIDITGGAPELNPNLPRLIGEISPYAARIMLRSNLSAMKDMLPELKDLLIDHRIAVVASFPSINITQTDSQRGAGIFQESVAVFNNYLTKLSTSFNPCAVEGLMCRSLVSVAWDGYVYDCDFNLARGLHLGGSKIHVSEMKAPPDPGSLIATADHCYTCTAGSGFT